ncbi:hypothetical protein NM208_g8905 [Fusarium decemcellulare]|uniref:Uncharacterized protein n=1 Tax=Fusarium decemcellulare TaxID=57161 RepID=A0ACC1S3N8_9HYPO|nr:hypothetical protein NM208_g8905 [Fusarium decemcellulare]
MSPKTTTSRNLTVLQKHIQFWDRDNDGIIHPWDVYSGFRELGFGLFFAIGSLLIPIFFSYPTRLGHSWLPDPLFRIYVKDIHKAKHGSDSGIYDFDGNFNPERFDQLFDRFDSFGVGGLTAEDLLNLWTKNRCAADPAGWSFAFMEWWTTWMLLQKDGLVWKDDLRACYDGSLFWKIKHERDRHADVFLWSLLCVDSNVDHMRRAHSFVIAEKNRLVVEIETLLAYFHLAIFGYFECLYRGSQRHTAEAAQQHMVGKSHFKFDL